MSSISSSSSAPSPRLASTPDMRPCSKAASSSRLASFLGTCGIKSRVNSIGYTCTRVWGGKKKA